MNIYVSNLSYSATDDNLNELFAAYGEVTSAKVIFDKYINRSRGFGFVEMSNDQDATAAINALNQTDHMGKTINVSEAQPREDRPRRDFNRGGGNDNRGGGGGKGGYNSDRRDTKRW
ncbi:MAG: RNA-binding protein [Bacteroidetes bacterium]|nr:RNA-binding protein [Bacteroidota bacterium]